MLRTSRMSLTRQARHGTRCQSFFAHCGSDTTGILLAFTESFLKTSRTLRPRTVVNNQINSSAFNSNTGALLKRFETLTQEENTICTPKYTQSKNTAASFPQRNCLHSNNLLHNETIPQIPSFANSHKHYSTKPPQQLLSPNMQTRSCVRVTTAEPHDFQEMPSPKGLPLIGTTLDLIAAGSAPRLHEYIDKRHRQLGPVFRESIGPVSAVFVSDPMEMRSVFNREGKHPRHVLPEAWTVYNRIKGYERGIFFMDGEEWLHFRRILNKLLLRTDGLQWIMDPCERVASTIVDRWKRHIGDKENAVIPNLEAELYRFSIDTVIAILLGDKYTDCRDVLEPEVTELASVVHMIFLTSAKLSLIPATVAATLRLPAWRKFVKAVDDGLNIAYTLMDKILTHCPKGSGLISKMQEENMNEKDIIRIVADLILAAGDTTAYSMQWTLFLLSKHPDVQHNLVQTTAEDSADNSLMKGIIREALRLYPVAPFLTRILPQDISLGGFTVPSNTLLIMSLYTSSRDPTNFPLPEKFWPERWNRKSGNAYLAASPYASLPFAMGTRSCIGRKIAETQMQVALTKITESFKLKLLNENDVEMVLRLVSVPSVPINIEISGRN